METRTEIRKSKSRKKWFLWLGGIFLFLLLLTALYFYYKIDETFSSMHNPLERDKDQERQETIQSIFKEEKTINILLLGVDADESDVGRTDVMIFMSLNPNTDSMMMFSIPRDTRVHIPGRNIEDKINHAYAYGKEELAIETVEAAFDLPVHFYAVVNMIGFKEGIDALGGVTVVNDLAFEHKGHHFPEGEIHLNGEEALSFVRMRKNDPQGDFGRNKRQRMIIESAMHKAASFSNITKIGSVLNIIGEHVRTDLSMGRLQSLFSSYRNTRNNIKTLEVNGRGEFIGPYWYYVVNDDEFQRIHTEINNHMEATQ